MSQQAKDEFYKDAEALAMDMAAAVNEEAHDLVAAGADVIQLDEPWVRNDPAAARRNAVKAINRATITVICWNETRRMPRRGRSNRPRTTSRPFGGGRLPWKISRRSPA